MQPALIELHKMFLVPATILFAALGVARTEGLKSGISIIGFVLSAIWVCSIVFWEDPKGGNGFSFNSVQWLIALAIPTVFGIVSGFSILVHAKAYFKSRNSVPSQDVSFMYLMINRTDRQP